MEKINWDDLFMSMVYLIAMKSKDESTHIGAVVVGPDHEIRSVGYNGFPRGINDYVAKRQERPLKYKFFEHGERNSIYNAALIGVSLKNCKMYTNGIPCTDCARAIIQSGIKEVVVDEEWNDGNKGRWKGEADLTLIMFNESNVKVRYWTGDLLDVVKCRRKKTWK